jgi:hypothetical protein
LVHSGLGNISLGIALSFAVGEALEDLDLLRIARKLLVYLWSIKYAGAKNVRNELCPRATYR